MKKIVLIAFYFTTFVSLLSAQTEVDSITKVDTVASFEIDTVTSFDSLSVKTEVDSIVPVVIKVPVKNKIDTIDIKGTPYIVCQKFPEEICGEYLYNKKGSPKVFLSSDGSGYFERHGVRPHELKFWIVCNEKGKITRTYGLDGNYFVTILFQYKDLDVRALGREYETLDIRIAYDEGYAIIHQERYHLFRR